MHSRLFSAVRLTPRLPSLRLRQGARTMATLPSTTGGTPASSVPAKTDSQAPNRPTTWSANQRPRNVAMTGPRFEQIDMAAQPHPPAAIEMIGAQPVIKVDTRIACCDGGGGALGHPKVFINLDRGVVESCGYCGLRFELEHHH